MQDNTTIPSPTQIEDSFDPYFLQFVFDARKTFHTAPFLFEFQGTNDDKAIPFSPLGGIQAVTGQKKNGKTFFMTMLAACCLEPNSPRILDYLKGLRMRQSVFTDADGNFHEPSILYVDTEMEEINTKLVQERIHWLCGWPINENHPRLHIIRLRTLPTTTSDGTQVDVPVERRRITKYWIEHFNPSLVFIDGLRDLVHDFNDNSESVEVINELMATAETNNICIWNALHYNPRPGNDDESKMRGHLGTELGNKVSDTFVVSKNKDKATSQVTFKVSQVDARSKDVSDIHFIISEEDSGRPNRPFAIPMITDEPQATPEQNVTVDDIAKWLWDADIEWPASRSQIKNKVFRDFVGIRGKQKQQDYLNMAVNGRILVDTTEKKNGAILLKLNKAMKPDTDNDSSL